MTSRDLEALLIAQGDAPERSNGVSHEIPSVRHVQSAKRIELECAAIAELLKAKNAKYGDSALNPLRVFSNADSVEQLRVRIDDKLSRLRAAGMRDDEDTILDLIGYLVMLRIALCR